MARAINSQALFESANSFPVYKDDFADGSVLWICEGICVFVYLQNSFIFSLLLLMCMLSLMYVFYPQGQPEHNEDFPASKLL